MQTLLESYGWAAGVATDLVNSSPVVRSGVDHLADADALVAFLADHGLASLADSRPTDDDVVAVDALRTRLRGVLETTDAVDLARAASGLTVPAAGGLALTDDATPQWRVAVRPETALADRLALVAGLGVLGALRALGIARFRPCASEVCSGLFIDTSRPGRRRYCMPELCGNRIHVANHRARRGTGR